MLHALRRVALPIVATALLAALAACQGAADLTPLPSGAEPPSDCARVDADGVIDLHAKDIKFSAPCLVADAGDAFTIHFTNDDSVPHDVAVYTDTTKSNEIIKGEIVNGSGQAADYDVEALDAGQYYFLCTLHPAMNGALYVVAPD